MVIDSSISVFVLFRGSRFFLIVHMYVPEFRLRLFLNKRKINKWNKTKKITNIGFSLHLTGADVDLFRQSPVYCNHYHVIHAKYTKLEVLERWSNRLSVSRRTLCFSCAAPALRPIQKTHKVCVNAQYSHSASCAPHSGPSGLLLAPTHNVVVLAK